jgi:hypothetical protein
MNHPIADAADHDHGGHGPTPSAKRGSHGWVSRPGAIGGDDHIAKSEPLICKEAIVEAGKILVTRSKTGAEVASSFGSIPDSRNILFSRLRARLAVRSPDLSLCGEPEKDARGLAIEIQIVESNTVGRRSNLLQAKCGRHWIVQPRAPIGFQSRSAFVKLHTTLALTFEAGIRRVEVQQRLQIARPARIQPIHDNGYLIEIVRQVRRTIYLIESGPACRGRRWSNGIVVNGH